MIRAEGYRQRLERELGLSFLEFNYQLLQAYDYLCLFQEYGCQLQLGGDDQWGNILAGVDLVRRVESERVHGVTFPLLTTASGAKMGKTAGGAVWLDAERTSPYEFYQYWINTDDRDVARFLAYFHLSPDGGDPTTRQFGRQSNSGSKGSPRISNHATCPRKSGGRQSTSSGARRVWVAETLTQWQYRLRLSHLIALIPVFRSWNCFMRSGWRIHAVRREGLSAGGCLHQRKAVPCNRYGSRYRPT